MTVYFTADTHFGHRRIIELCQRPFETVDEMDEAIIANWNAVVGERDEVWHLGDFALGRKAKRLRSIFDRLNGSKRLIIGNYDRDDVLKLPWTAPPAHYAEIGVGGQPVVLFHYGLRVWNGMQRGAVQLYGHSHGLLPGSHASLDVGVDCWDLKPVKMSQIRERLATLPLTRPEPNEAIYHARLPAGARMIET